MYGKCLLPLPARRHARMKTLSFNTTPASSRPRPKGAPGLLSILSLQQLLQRFLVWLVQSLSAVRRKLFKARQKDAFAVIGAWDASVLRQG